METTQTISDIESASSQYSTQLPVRTFLYSALGLGTIFYYIQFGAPLVTQYYFSGAAIPNLHLAIISLLVVLTLTAIGCSIHVRILGGFEKTDIQREIKKEIGRLRNIYATATTQISRIESEIFENHAELTPRGSEALRTLKKVATALDKRIQTTSALGRSDKLPELFRATEILRKKLKTSESATTSLIDIDPIPAILPSQIENLVLSLSREIQVSNRLAA
jgi:hypothetical protein